MVTGLGAVSAIGNNKGEVLDSLLHGKSGIVFVPEMEKSGFKCCVSGPIRDLDERLIPKKAMLTMSDVAKYGMVAALEALGDAGVVSEDLQTERAGVVVGTCVGGMGEITRIENMVEEGIRISHAGAKGAVRIMNSTVSENLAAYLGVQGPTYSISTACCTGADCIGHAYRLLKHGVLDICIAGGGEEELWRQIGPCFDNTGEMPKSWNEQPARACRPYDRDREGFALSAGAGIVILETFEHAQGRNADIYAQVVSYASTNDGEDMFRPSGEGLKRAVEQAMTYAEDFGVTRIDYINPHGSGTKVGDETEARVIRDLFGRGTLVSSTKSLTGHSMGATGALEVIFTLLMMRHEFVAATANLENVAPECKGISHVRTTQKAYLKTAMSFNFGLAGTNACLVFQKL